jgi:fatty-acyl-CoA synthase
MLVVDAATFRDRGGDLAAKATGVKTVFTLRPANYGIDLLQAIEAAGHANPRSFAGADDIATLNYTGGGGQIKGALRTHKEYGGFAAAIPPTEIRTRRAISTVIDQPCRGHKGAADADTRRHRAAYAEGFDPEAVFKTIEREKINFTLFVPTMIYVLLDHPALDKTDLSSLELLLYGASAMSPSRLVEGINGSGRSLAALRPKTNAIRWRFCARPIMIRRRPSCSCPADSRSPPAT